MGNDVVDLGDPESRSGSLHPRFDSRVFSPEEREAIVASAEPERQRWRLWAAKEASYKVARQLDSATVFSPVRFEVFGLEGEGPRGAGEAVLLGHVGHRGQRLEVRLSEGEEFVHAVARPTWIPARSVVWGLGRLAAGETDAQDPTGPGRAVRALCCSQLARELGVSPSELEVRRRGRVPLLLLRGRPAAVGLSLSHHGRFVAFASVLREEHRSRSRHAGGVPCAQAGFARR